MKYRIVRTHVETFVYDGVEAGSPEEAVKYAKKNLSPEDFDSVKQSKYEYKAIPEAVLD